jgi:hypothetical protein
MSSIDKSKKMVTDAINAFFSSPNMNCQILNMTEPQNTNKDNQIKFINLLNEKINDNSIVLYDINSLIKSNINNINIDENDNTKIIYTYTNGIIPNSTNYKKYSIAISLFLKSIIICNDKIFLLPSIFKYNKESTINFNSKKITKTNINDLYQTSSAASPAASPVASSAASSAAKAAANYEKLINNFFTKDVEKYNVITDYQDGRHNNSLIEALNNKLKDGTITLSDLNFTRHGNIEKIIIVNQEDFKDNGKYFEKYKAGKEPYVFGIKYKNTSDYYPVLPKIFIENIFINNNNIFYLNSPNVFNKKNTPFFTTLVKVPISIENIIRIFNTSKRKLPSSFVVPKISPYLSRYSNKPLSTISRSNIREVLQNSENIRKEKYVITEISRSNDYKALNSNMSRPIINKTLKKLIEPYRTDRQYKNSRINIVFKTLRDNILMPPPEPRPSKRSRLGGNNKILRRKIYIDDNGKLFIKLNKYTIIDLYK